MVLRLSQCPPLLVEAMLLRGSEQPEELPGQIERVQQSRELPRKGQTPKAWVCLAETQRLSQLQLAQSQIPERQQKDGKCPPLLCRRVIPLRQPWLDSLGGLMDSLVGGGGQKVLEIF